ncbi:histidine--tRNA ligase [Enterobacteriaceae bacterium ET-AT1-13]|nr:histidine--tRNA ligase [Enterobacteriaceae bacterium ET-AT1-13]WGS66492.1 histidine--tRNA ligase [Enterobacteriaceae bacterium Cmel17]WMC17516.1 MAG: histidine--tRNA ligase [Enterobacteriaceae bacterium Cmel21]WMC17723.1 MAG: histidine--tRNA ligase [Enterobacteriaceae bacterium PSmelAO3-2]WMC17927.1 MAG: histidine--tRNA ligase [Enterobacteriaceae bacterium PSmelAO3-1]WMC18130.1 MAG: histidine--tRNA ligase [Enterobacteriaceae bacterium PSmelAO1]
MNKKLKSIRGMNDFLPIDTYLWQKIENSIKKIINSYGYSEIRLPIIEKTNLFKYAIGKETDVIKKEMFNFNDRNNENITLRPEATVSCVRSGIEHGFLYQKEQRLWYIGPMFRYERPQKGRYRQFYQFGIEVFGLIGPQIDAELILIMSRIWKKLDLLNYFSLEINTIGSIKTRIKYNNDLTLFFKKNINLLDFESIKKINNNPIRILDSKNIKIQKLIKKAPCIYKYLSKKCKIHFYKLCKILKNIGIKYNINKKIVRGLDYYNYTVFEWVTKNINFKSTICGGGRYDKLVKNLGGNKTPAIGCAIGLDRLILLIKSTKNILKYNLSIDINIISFNIFNIKFNIIKLVEYIHDKLPKLRIFTNYNNSNIKKQLINSHKIFSNIALIIGKNEIYNQSLIIKNINNKIQIILPKNEIVIYFKILFFKICSN